MWGRVVSVAVLACACGRSGFSPRDYAASDAPPIDACAPIAGLVGYWPMEPGDLVGTVLHDRSGHGNDGNVSGSPAPVLAPGRVGDALDFSATTTAYVDFASVPVDASGGAAATVAGWFYRAGTASEVLFDYPPPNVRYDLWWDNNFLCVNTQNSECWGLAGNWQGSWHHVAVVLVNGLETQSAIYLDGVAQALGCQYPMFPCTISRTVMPPLRLGASDNFAYHGMLDEVRLYDRALTAAEVAALATGSPCAP